MIYEKNKIKYFHRLFKIHLNAKGFATLILYFIHKGNNVMFKIIFPSERGL